MTLLLLAFLGGVLTILSPCVLPVLPFVFARAEQPFFKSGLPLLLGMALTFAGIATLAAVGGAWAVRVNEYGRVLALVLLGVFAVTLLSRRVSEWIARPFVALGNRLISSDPGSQPRAGILHSALLGIATGLLWAPCAGPILGLILTGAALSGPNTQTTLLLIAYSAGAATSLAVALSAGGRVFTALKKSLGAGEWVRRGLGAAILLAVIAIALGWDTGVLTRWSLASTNRFEQSIIERIQPRDMQDMPVQGQLPSLAGATSWLNSAPLTPEALRGKVVLVDFWTYSCINCLRAMPYVKAWYERYRDHGLVVLGVHTPEFAFEKREDNVRRAVQDLGIAHPVALDNNYAIWRAFKNRYWPAHYFIDAQGHIRSHHFGEGHYQESERTLRELLREAGFQDLPAQGAAKPKATGVQAAADRARIKSPETYVGYRRAARFSSPGGIERSQPKVYETPGKLELNQWGLVGPWVVEEEHAALQSAPGSIKFRFYARDLHLVLGPGADGKPIRFRVRVDDGAPGENRGADIDADGNGVVREERLYQLIRQSDEVRERTFSIQFLDGDVQVFAFTFG